MGCSAKPKKLYLEKLFATYYPRKLYCGLRVEFNQVPKGKLDLAIMLTRLLMTMIWKVTLHIWQSGRKLSPTKYKYNFTEFLSNKFVLNLIQFPLDTLHPGNEWVNQMLSLVTGKSTSLTEMPENFLRDLSQYLTIGDLLNLSSTCKYFHKVWHFEFLKGLHGLKTKSFQFEKFFSTDEIWEPIFEKFLRCICTFADYDQGQKMGGFKYICQQIFQRNCGNNHTKNLLKNEDFLIGCSSAKLFMNLTVNKLEKDDLHVDSHLNFLTESEEVQDDNKQDKKSSSSQIRSEIEIATQSYFGAPNNSALSVAQHLGGEEFTEAKEKTDSAGYINMTSSNASVLDKNDLHFTKRDLRRRLENLLEKTKKFECTEDCLAGDKTVKYCLKYREN